MIRKKMWQNIVTQLVVKLTESLNMASSDESEDGITVLPAPLSIAVVL
jgi:hypothetical protein